MVPLRQDATQTRKCVEEALESRRPFYAGLQVQGIDSQIWQGFARARGKAVIWVSYVSDVNGSDIPLLRIPKLAQYPCAHPRFEQGHFGTVLRCD